MPPNQAGLEAHHASVARAAHAHPLEDTNPLRARSFGLGSAQGSDLTGSGRVTVWAPPVLRAGVLVMDTPTLHPSKASVSSTAAVQGSFRALCALWLGMRGWEEVASVKAGM